MLRAINAASNRNVPLPHIGSSNGCCAVQPTSRRIPAARFSRTGAAVRDAPQQPAGDPAVEVDCVAEGKRAGEGYPARAVGHVLRAQLLQLGTQHRLQPTRARGEEGLVLLTHLGRTSGRFRAETYGFASERRKGNESSPRKARLIPGYSRDTCNFRTWS